MRHYNAYVEAASAWAEYERTWFSLHWWITKDWLRLAHLKIHVETRWRYKV